MALLSVTVRGERHLDRKFRQNLARKRRAVHRGVRDSLKGLERAWKRRVREDSGRLSRSSRVVMGSLPKGRGRLVIAPSHMDPVWEERDTKPHIIVPRRKKMLRFTVGGRVVFARMVRHPGTKGSHALQRSIDASRRILRPRLQSIMDNA